MQGVFSARFSVLHLKGARLPLIQPQDPYLRLAARFRMDTAPRRQSNFFRSKDYGLIKGQGSRVLFFGTLVQHQSVCLSKYLVGFLRNCVNTTFIDQRRISQEQEPRLELQEVLQGQEGQQTSGWGGRGCSTTRFSSSLYDGAAN